MVLSFGYRANVSGEPVKYWFHDGWMQAELSAHGCFIFSPCWLYVALLQASNSQLLAGCRVNGDSVLINVTKVPKKKYLRRIVPKCLLNARALYWLNTFRKLLDHIIWINYEVGSIAWLNSVLTMYKDTSAGSWWPGTLWRCWLHSAVENRKPRCVKGDCCVNGEWEVQATLWWWGYNTCKEWCSEAVPWYKVGLSSISN